MKTFLRCTECHNVVEIFRKINRQKKKGHIKHMYCPYCKKVVAFEELKNEPSMYDS